MGDLQLQKGYRVCTCASLIGCGIRLIIIFAVISSAVTAPSLSSSLVGGGQYACLGSDVTFTCETRGANAIVWLSDEYVGANDQLVFDAGRNNPGDTRTSSVVAGTLATLTRKYSDQGTTVLESMLRIRINSLLDSRTATVTCSDIRQSTGRSFQVIGRAGAPEDVVAIQIRRTESNCVIHTLWRSQSNVVSEYQIFANESIMTDFDTATVKTTNGTIESALLPMQCGVHIIRVGATNVCSQTFESPNVKINHIQHMLETIPTADLTEIFTTVTNGASVNPNLKNMANAGEGVHRRIGLLHVGVIHYAH